jgi:chorismate mutase
MPSVASGRVAVQALSKRVHYGKFIAEAKFSADPRAYEDLIRAGDAAGLMHLLTYPEQEERVISRVASKAAIFGQDVGNDGRAMSAAYKVQPDLVADLYREWVMPLTKEVQVCRALLPVSCHLGVVTRLLSPGCGCRTAYARLSVVVPRPAHAVCGLPVHCLAVLCLAGCCLVGMQPITSAAAVPATAALFGYCPLCCPRYPRHRGIT